MTGHLVRFNYRDAEILEHPDGEADCPVPAMIESMRLDDGRMQVQGLYRETPGGEGYERVGR